MNEKVRKFLMKIIPIEKRIEFHNFLLDIKKDWYKEWEQEYLKNKKGEK